MNIDALKSTIEIDEARRKFPYDDATGKELKAGDTVRGFITIGIGINLSAGLDDQEISWLLDYRLNKACSQLDAALPWWRRMSDQRQEVLANMCFNMGIGNSTKGLLSFKNTLAAMQAGDYRKAAQGMRDSTWHKQVGQRAERLAKMMEEG